MAKIEVNTIDNISGSSTLNLGDTNATAVTIDSGVSTLTIPNGITTGHMYPAFEAYVSSDQTLSDGVNAKVQFDTEIFDTDNCYDNSTNYRFTPTVAGKYYISVSLKAECTAQTINNVTIYIHKSGSTYKRNVLYASDNSPGAFPITLDAIVDMNGSSDYIEVFIFLDVSSGTPRVDADIKASHFKAYRLGA